MPIVTSSWFGDGEKQVKKFFIKSNEVELEIIEYGATITSLKVADKLGKKHDIVLGFDDLSDYEKQSPYFGCIVGRFANRIAGGQFKLNGKFFLLATNNGPNHLHGGVKGFNKVVWSGEIKDNAVQFSYTSPNLEENYPGELKCKVTYKLTEEKELFIHYEATTNEATPINLTNHSYFNLAGHDAGTICAQTISINADHYLPIDETSIPTSEIQPVSSTPFDLRNPQSLDDLLKTLPNGYDHNFCINGSAGSLRKAASAHHPFSGLQMDVFTTQPGIQFYTANFLPEENILRGKNNQFYKKQSAFCLETQNYPDAINNENFPKAYIEPGEVYEHTTKFVFSVK